MVTVGIHPGGAGGLINVSAFIESHKAARVNATATTAAGHITVIVAVIERTSIVPDKPAGVKSTARDGSGTVRIIDWT
jgi:hypothetical protein